ncbi:MAG: HdeD family acid-resistance protein, partial [Candidatus Limnocylindrales bacterium]
MLNLLARNWWLIEIRGVAAIAFGILAFVWPGLTLVVLITLFAAYMLIDGVSLLLALARGEPTTTGHRLAVGLMGVLGVLVAVVTVLVPGLTALSLLYLVAFWAITLGASQVIAAIRLRREIKGELWLVIGGLLTIAFGVLLVAFPGT